MGNITFISMHVNPWGATKQSKALTLPGISQKASVVTFCRNIRFGNMPESAAIRKNVRENCRALIVRGCDEWGRRSIAFGLQCTALEPSACSVRKAFDMKYAKRSKLPRGLRWDAKSPHICFSWRDERGSQHQQSTHTADPAEAMAFKLRFLREKQDVVEVRKVRSMDQSRLALATAADLIAPTRMGGNDPLTDEIVGQLLQELDGISRVTARSFSLRPRIMPSRSIAPCCPGFRSGWRFHFRIYMDGSGCSPCFSRRSGFPSHWRREAARLPP
jgi:hypothetical protein